MSTSSMYGPMTGARRSSSSSVDRMATLPQRRPTSVNRAITIVQASSNAMTATNSPQTGPNALTRRAALTAAAAAFAFAARPSTAAADATEPSVASPATPSISILSSEAGTGTAPAQRGDLVLIHYVGTLADGTVFDSTKGGLKYRDGGDGVFRPVAVKLGGDPVPGICDGLTAAVVGLRVGGRATVEVPPELGFGSTPVLAPYAVVPGGSRLRYDVELVRLSRRGPDALLQGVTQCGGGFVNERTAGCGEITVAEFI